MLKKIKTAYLAEKLKTQNLGAGGGGGGRGGRRNKKIVYRD